MARRARGGHDRGSHPPRPSRLGRGGRGGGPAPVRQLARWGAAMAAVADPGAGGGRAGMTTVSAATWIDAPPATVWAVLTDLARYPEWNPLFPQADGDLATGQRITLRRAPGGGFPGTIRPRVTALSPDTELQWESRLPGLITGQHRFTLKPGNGGTL